MDPLDLLRSVPRNAQTLEEACQSLFQIYIKSGLGKELAYVSIQRNLHTVRVERLAAEVFEAFTKELANTQRKIGKEVLLY